MARYFLLFALLSFPLSGSGMSEDKFWALIEKSNKSAGHDLGKIPLFLRKELEKSSPNEIVEFKDQFKKRLCEAHTWPLWGAAYVINGGASDDGFDYFKMALIASGKKAFQIGIKNPDELSGLELQKLEGSFELEEIDYVPDEAYKSKAGEELDYEPKAICLEPKGKTWKEDDLPKLYPKLSKKYLK